MSVGLLHVEASSDSVAALLVQLHQRSFLIWQLKGSWVQIPKAGGVETGTMRCPVQSWACSCCRSANTQQLTSHNALAIQSSPLNAQTKFAHPPVLTSVPKSSSKNNLIDEFAFAQGRNNPDCLPQHSLHMHYRNFILFYSKSFDWGGPAPLADLVLTHQVAFANVHPNVWRLPWPLLSV